MVDKETELKKIKSWLRYMDLSIEEIICCPDGNYYCRVADKKGIFTVNITANGYAPANPRGSLINEPVVKVF